MNSDDERGSRSGIDRRRFLRLLEVRGVAAVCAHSVGVTALASFVSGCGGFRYAHSSLVGSQLFVERKDLAAPGVMVDGPDGELPLYVRMISADEFTALSMRCMHRGCQVEPMDERFVCPCHGSEYGADGRVLKGPTEHALLEYRVTATAARITIHLNAPVARERGT